MQCFFFLAQIWIWCTARKGWNLLEIQPLGFSKESPGFTKNQLLQGVRPPLPMALVWGWWCRTCSGRGVRIQGWTGWRSSEASSEISFNKSRRIICWNLGCLISRDPQFLSGWRSEKCTGRKKSFKLFDRETALPHWLCAARGHIFFPFRNNKEGSTLWLWRQLTLLSPASRHASGFRGYRLYSFDHSSFNNANTCFFRPIFIAYFILAIHDYHSVFQFQKLTNMFLLAFLVKKRYVLDMK